MFLFINIYILLLGLCIGSFLNFVICRISLPHFSFWKDLATAKTSYCPHCKHALSWPDLVPVASFLFLRGKCRYCGQNISWQYPVVEISTALIFLIIFNSSALSSLPKGYQLSIINQISIFQSIHLLFLFYVASSLIVIFVYDLRYYLIPDNILFPAILVAFLYRLFYVSSFAHYLGAATIAAGFFLVIFLVSKGEWMGFGDVKLAVLLGLVLGFPNILAGLFLSFFFGAIIGILLMLSGKKRLKSQMPFAPFLIVGTGAAMVWGQQIINWYFHFLVF